MKDFEYILDKVVADKKFSRSEKEALDKGLEAKQYDEHQLAALRSQLFNFFNSGPLYILYNLFIVNNITEHFYCSAGSCSRKNGCSIRGIIGTSRRCMRACSCRIGW